MVRNGSSTSSKRKIAYLLGLLLIIVMISVVLLLKHNADTNKAAHTTTIPSKKQATASTSNSDKKALMQDNASKASDKTTGPAQPSAELKTPSTDGLVSNHRPTSSLPGEQSICATTAGASCFISFNKNDITKKLEAQTTDANGFAYWTWDINSAGLTEGTWKISVTATLNGESKSAEDPITLIVQP